MKLSPNAVAVAQTFRLLRRNLSLTPRFNAVAEGIAPRKTVTNGFSSVLRWTTQLKPGVKENVFFKPTSKSAVSQVSKLAQRLANRGEPYFRLPADLEVGDTAGLETRATSFVEVSS
jgi:hypothetical protein